MLICVLQIIVVWKCCVCWVVVRMEDCLSGEVGIAMDCVCPLQLDGCGLHSVPIRPPWDTFVCPHSPNVSFVSSLFQSVRFFGGSVFGTVVDRDTVNCFEMRA